MPITLQLLTGYMTITGLMLISRILSYNELISEMWLQKFVLGKKASHFQVFAKFVGTLEKIFDGTRPSVTYVDEERFHSLSCDN